MFGISKVELRTIELPATGWAIGKACHGADGSCANLQLGAMSGCATTPRGASGQFSELEQTSAEI